LGQNPHWPKAVARIANEAIRVGPIQCSASYLECLDRLPEADPGSLLWVDATRQPKVRAVVQRLRQQGWRYVVVVTADPSWGEAHAVLRGTVGYDYWEK
jgi:TusA-related sulfurtransferase